MIRKPLIHAACLLMGCSFLLGAASIPATSGTITDASGRSVNVENVSRIVSAGGSVTEVLYALGLDKEIVAVDTTSLYPAAALRDHPNVGYLRALSAEGLLAVDPTVILAEADAGPPPVVDQLKGASIPFVTVPDETTPAGVADKIRFIGKLVGKAAEGDQMAATVLADFKALEGKLAAVKDSPRVLFILSVASGRMMASGSGTSADEMIKLAGARNALSGFDGYKPVSAEAVIAAAPDVVLMMTRGGSGHGAGDILNDPAISQTPAGKNKRLVTMDGLLLLGFGPRTAHAATELASQLHPEAKIEPLPPRAWTE
ncbi:iron complex transport system substrate-binding protein [Rhodoligotrophos appendicifer]|uniref:heme/hemin ABC transporter substrate-binding protein n=1 Tax=Rhodoligotrophos appendicifer TaxID=987056 RepID=UPI0011863DC6|nr:ABC transporter substrate-binding protein [Rhodoligotrophos appendicifer]